MFLFNISSHFRERPAAIPVEVKSIDDTSNFDEFPDVDLKIRMYFLIESFLSFFRIGINNHR